MAARPVNVGKAGRSNGSSKWKLRSGGQGKSELAIDGWLRFLLLSSHCVLRYLLRSPPIEDTDYLYSSSSTSPTMSDEPRKRSRFDQVGDSEPPRRSKFDRRSRSPPKGDSEAATRSRSPVVKSVEGGAQKKDPAAAAAEAAARINAQLSQKKAPQHVDVPPIRPSVWL